jgi:RHS repeat-associated protein
MYQEQERQDELGLNWDSFKWRNYNPEIARFMNIDPLTEDYYDYTPYQFSSNQPVHAREIEGLESANDKNKQREAVTVKNDAIPKNTQMRAEGDRAAKLLEARQKHPPTPGSQPYNGPTLVQGPRYSTAEEKKRHDNAVAKRQEAIEMSKNIVANHDNLGSPYTAKTVMDGVVEGEAIVSTAALVTSLPKTFGNIFKSFRSINVVEGAAATQRTATAPVGRIGSPLMDVSGNAAEVINGRTFTGHALDQMQSRGLFPTVVEDVIQNGASAAGREAGTFTHQLNGVRAVTNEAGDVITTYPKTH